MSDLLASIFNDFDRGGLSRRQLLQALGIAVAVRPVAALAQGQCGGARAGTPGCDPTPAPLPFERTGWNTVLLDHFTMQVADYQKEAAYYAALMNWKVRSDDGKQAMLDIGDWGAVVIRGGYEPPPAPTPTATPTPTPAGAADAGAGGAGRGGGRGGGGGRGTPRLAVWDSFCWGIEPWDAKKVEAELKKRGLNPVADNDPKQDFQSFRIKDPNGFDLRISNGNRKNRRTKPAAAKLAVPAPFESTAWKSVFLDHLSFECTDYKAAVAFYDALLGWKPGTDEGSQNQVQIGDIGDAIIRRGGGGGRGGGTPDPAAPVVRRAGLGHIAFGIQPWDADAVKAELDKRGLSASPDTGGNGDIHTAKYQSYHTNTPNGFNLQISNVTKATRGS